MNRRSCPAWLSVTALVFLITPLLPGQGLIAQPGQDMRAVLERLEKLEKQNRELQAEIDQLRRELGSVPVAAAVPPPAQPPVTERLDVQEARTEELAQSKVETSQKQPVALTGMLLFNAFANTRFGGTLQEPVTASATPGTNNTGASFRQTVLGLKFNGPTLPGGGKATGSFYMDFWGGAATPSNNLFRIRLATLDLAWKNTTFTVGQDKPIVAPREPTTLAMVGLAPLTGAGNLWNWNPEVRVQQRFNFSENTGVSAEFGVFQTTEIASAAVPGGIAATLEMARPAWEGRFNLHHDSGDRQFAFAPGFHTGVTHVAGKSIPSDLFTMDWLVKPVSFFQVDGAYFHGTNAAGLGGIRQGFSVLSNGAIVPVHTTGGWTQATFFATPKLSFHVFGGEEANRGADLTGNSVRRNLIYAGNAIYKLAPNVLAAIELSQNRTSYTVSGTRLNNHYDLAIAYLF